MKVKKWFWGLFFILAGGLFIANALNLFPTNINIMSLVFTIALLAIIVGSLIHFNFFGILVPVAVIGSIFAEELNITHITPWPLIITAVLVSIGLEIIFSRKGRMKFIHIGTSGEDFDEIIDEEDRDEVRYKVSFGSGAKYVNANNFKKGYFSCSFGALKVYFDNAKPSKDGAEIILDISFAGAELYIPKEWDVVIGVSATLGGIEERRRYEKKDGPKVTIKGNVSLGGVEIIYI